MRYYIRFNFQKVSKIFSDAEKRVKDEVKRLEKERKEKEEKEKKEKEAEKKFTLS